MFATYVLINVYIYICTVKQNTEIRMEKQWGNKYLFPLFHCEFEIGRFEFGILLFDQILTCFVGPRPHNNTFLKWAMIVSQFLKFSRPHNQSLKNWRWPVTISDDICIPTDKKVAKNFCKPEKCNSTIPQAAEKQNQSIRIRTHRMKLV